MQAAPPAKVAIPKSPCGSVGDTKTGIAYQQAGLCHYGAIENC